MDEGTQPEGERAPGPANEPTLTNWDPGQTAQMPSAPATDQFPVFAYDPAPAAPPAPPTPAAPPYAAAEQPTYPPPTPAAPPYAGAEQPTYPPPPPAAPYAGAERPTYLEGGQSAAPLPSGAAFSAAGGQPSYPPPPPAPPYPPPPAGAPPAGGPGGSPAPTGTSRRSLLAAVMVVALVAGSIGAGAGAALANRHHNSNPAPAAQSTPLAPFTPPRFSNPGGSTSPSTTPGGPSPATSSIDTAAIAAKVNPAVADINTVLGYQHASAAGTGMVITPNGEVLTNNHVVQGATSIKVTLPSTGKTYSATVLGTAPTQDVALLQLQGASGLKTISIGDPSKVSPGDPVVAIGNALGKGGTPAVSAGTISAVNQSITAGDPSAGTSERLTGLIQTDAQLQPGDSGGPLVNASAQVIGMDTAASAGTQFDTSSNTGFAIPINTAMSIAHQIEQGKASSTVLIGQTGFLGVQVRDAVNSSGQAGGAQIVGVANGSPASSAGLTAGDVITTFDGKSVTSSSGLTSQVNTHHPGDKVNVGWVDQAGQSHTAQITLTTGPVK